MKPSIKNMKAPRQWYRRPYSTGDPIKNYILLLLILLLLSAFVLGSCSPAPTAGASLSEAVTCAATVGSLQLPSSLASIYKNQ